MTDAGGAIAAPMRDAGPPYFTRDPRHVHLNWTGDPATTVTALWSTDESAPPGVVEYGPGDGVAQATVQTVGSRGNTVTVHEATLRGLRPDTTYRYRVGSEGHWSREYHFKTAPAPDAMDPTVNFVALGDSRDDVSVWGQTQARIAGTLTGRDQPDFQVFTGDAVLFGPIQDLWNRWFDAAPEAFANMPWVVVHGNHEVLAVNYLAQFAGPPEPGGEQYYALDYGPLHLVVLNDSPLDLDPRIISETEARWLDRDLAAVDRRRTPWVIAMHHKSPYTSSMHRLDADGALLREAWVPVYDRHHVDLVLCGHDHNIEVTHPLRAGRPVGPREGTVYVTTAGAGANLYTAGTSEFTRYSESVVNFVQVRATRARLELTPYRLDGTVIMGARVTLER
ncbi:MAG: metallophosphoesterase family protein [Deltaproteobacteria bacterium]|nr:metallophosphoesterase family protein [Deltaproteobacteria bacterium]